MARIRTIKPELWTDPEFVELSLSARLLFIASLNFATDHGVLPEKPRQLKMQCLPADAVDVDVLIEELVRHRFIVRRVAPNGDHVLVIRTFNKNQKVNRPTHGRWGNPDEWATDPPQPPRPHGALTEDSPREGIIRKGRDNSEGDDSDPEFKSVKQNITTGETNGRRADFQVLTNEAFREPA